MRFVSIWWGVGSVTLISLIWGCSDGGAVGSSGFTEDDPVAANVDESCNDEVACRDGLVCGQAGVCELGRTLGEGQPCLLGGECLDGLQCLSGACAPAGEGAVGDPCATDAGCQSGLRCGLVGFAAQCIEEGSADVGQECATSGSCYAGLLCAPDGTCAPAPPGTPTLGVPKSPEITCAEASDGAVVAHFEVPGAEGSDPEGDFFRLPFPNDARRKDGRLDFDGFPTPGVSPLVGFDPVQVYIDAIVESESGWGTYPTVLFRFSGGIDLDSLSAPDGEPGRVRWVDITDPADPRSRGLRWYVSSGGGEYICRNWMGVRRPHGLPLEGGHTYAVYLTTDARDSNGEPIERAEQLEAMLAEGAPSDPALSHAHSVYAPFRAYLTAEGIDPSTILNASVITASESTATMSALAAATYAAPAPTASSWVKCGGGAASPCPQAEEDRACGETTDDYDEYHALVELPIFQEGTAPYFESGGGIDTSGPVRTESVCMALTVPKVAAPQGGYPLVVYGHGTGGSFRSHVRDEVAGALARATTPSGAAVPMAVLGIDAVQHGPRRGDSTESPNNLFFNFANPDAARGNPMQGAADVISLGRFAQTLVVPAEATGGDAVDIDESRVVFFGHSQGSTHGSLGLPYSTELSAAVLSGNGASLMHALLEKTEPVNIAAAVPLVLGDFNADFELPGGQMHPVLSVVQQWIDPSDPVTFARHIALEPAEGVAPKHVLQTYGLGDTFSPPLTMETYALGAGLDLVAHDSSVGEPDEIGSLEPMPTPMSGNETPDTNPLTLAVRQYGPPEGRDGHFVVFDVAGANADMARFLAMAASGETPAVGE